MLVAGALQLLVVCGQTEVGQLSRAQPVGLCGEPV